MVAALVARVAADDPDALAELYSVTAAKLLGVCLRILHDPSESEDVLQEVYITVWRRAGDYDPTRGLSPITWLASIARNRAIDRVRALGPSSRRLGEEAGLLVPDPAPSAHETVSSSEDARRLEACLGELDARSRAAIRTAFFEGVTYDGVAQRMGEPLGTVKSWIRRGLQRLRECLER